MNDLTITRHQGYRPGEHIFVNLILHDWNNTTKSVLRETLNDRNFWWFGLLLGGETYRAVSDKQTSAKD
jgi:hypothetical protein